MCNAPAGYQVYLNAGVYKVVCSAGREKWFPSLKKSLVQESDLVLNDLQKRIVESSLGEIISSDSAIWVSELNRVVEFSFVEVVSEKHLK